MTISLNAVNVGAADESRTGAAGNEPAGGFFEDTTTVRTHNDTATTTAFVQGDVIHVNITTQMFTSVPDHGKLRLQKYDGTTLVETPGQDAFVLVASSGGDYSYAASIDTGLTTITDDHYLLVAELRNTGAGETEILFQDVIIFGTGGTAQRSISLARDDTFAQEAYNFNNRDSIFIKVYTPQSILAANSSVLLCNYFDVSHEVTLDDLANTTISRSGSYSIMEVDLAADFDFENLGSAFNPGNWYTLQVDLEDSSENAMAADWSVQFMVSPAPQITSTFADPQSVEMTSSASTVVTVDFTDTDAADVNEFEVMLKVRDEAKNVFTILSGGKHNVGGLTILDLGGGNYRALFTWDPPGTMLKGDYDLYSHVKDGNGSAGEDDFDNNKNELELTTSATTPAIVSGAVWVDPSVVDRVGADTTTIYANFTDPQDTNKDNLEITFAVRSATNNIITLVDAKGDGEAGQFGGTLDVKDDKGWYTASYDWDPAADTELGLYDLMVDVTGYGGTAIDSFDNNTDELEVVDLGVAPSIKVGSIVARPSSLEKVGAITTNITADFIDTDDHAIGEFDLTMKIKNDNGDELTLLSGASSGEAGELGGTLSVEKLLAGNYSMSLTWDPDETTPVGMYDFWMQVTDKNGKSATSGYGANQDLLNITTDVKPPEIKTVSATPKIVNKDGFGRSTIFGEFTDENFDSVSNFSMTFKVKDPDNNVIVLVDDKGNGGTGEVGPETVRITFSGTVFLAEYDWNPADDSVIGMYDLHFGVKNDAGGFAEEGFGANQDELEVITTLNPPKMNDSATWADPDKLEISGTNSTLISAKFSDADLSLPSIFKVSFKVRNETDGVISLAEKLGHNESAPSGGVVNVENGTENGSYIASLRWDPPDGTDPGLYDLFFSVQDDTLAVFEDGFDKNLNELNLTLAGGPTTPHSKIELDVEIEHEEEAWYNFTVVYTHEDNLPPDEHGVILEIDGEKYQMKESDVNDTDYSDGKHYYLRYQLHEAEHEYSVMVNDTSGEGLWLPEETYHPSKEIHGDHKTEDTFWQVALTVLIIIILLVIILLVARGKKPARETPPPYTPPPAETTAEPAAEQPPMAEPVTDDAEAAEAEPAEPAEPAEAEPALEAEPAEITDPGTPGEPTVTKIPPAEPPE